MRIFVATDIHGSAYWAERIVEEFKKSECEVLILLGDVYNHGPRNPFPRDYAPMKVAEIFNSIADKVIAIKGNCDSEVDEMISDFPFVAQEIIPYNGHKLFFTHGHVYNKDNLPKVSSGDMLFYGHFHVNEIKIVKGITCVNVSSASLPKDKAAICIVSENCVALYALEEVSSGDPETLGFMITKYE